MAKRCWQTLARKVEARGMRGRIYEATGGKVMVVVVVMVMVMVMVMVVVVVVVVVVVMEVIRYIIIIIIIMQRWIIIIIIIQQRSAATKTEHVLSMLMFRASLFNGHSKARQTKASQRSQSTKQENKPH